MYIPTKMPSNSKPTALSLQKAPKNPRWSLFDCCSKYVVSLRDNKACNPSCITERSITPHLHPHKQLELQPLTTATCYSSLSPINTPRLSGFALFHLILLLIVVGRCSWEKTTPQHTHTYTEWESVTTLCEEQYTNIYTLESMQVRSSTNISSRHKGKKQCTVCKTQTRGTALKSFCVLVCPRHLFLS